MDNNLAQRLGELDEEKVLDTVLLLKEKGVEPLDIIAQLQRGMEIVGKKFETQEMFLSELIYSAAIFRKAVESLVILLKLRKQLITVPWLSARRMKISMILEKIWWLH